MMLVLYGNKQHLQWEENIKIRLFNQGRNYCILYLSGNKKLFMEKGENSKELEEITFVSSSTNAWEWHAQYNYKHVMLIGNT